MQIIQRLRQELKTHVDSAYKVENQRFFTEHVKLYGVRTPIVRQLARTYYHDLNSAPKEEVFKICEKLMKSGYQEEFLIASFWAFGQRRQCCATDLAIFERWVHKYVTNWATCDDFCTKSLGHLLYDHPELISEIRTWSTSKNSWKRRACAVSFIVPVRNGKYLDTVFAIADDLLDHPESQVQKGYGWMLKEAANIFPAEVYEFVLKRKAYMPRTALRYAIEKMPPAWKQKAMR